MKYESYIFDLDGTLLNTLNDLAASCNFALRSYGLPEHSVDDIRRFVGNGVRLLMTRATPGGESFEHFEECFACFRQHYLQHNLDTTAPYPGIMELITQLNANGKKIAVVSNKFYQATQDLVRYFFGEQIKVAIGERPDIHKKPAPDTVIEALRQLDMPSSTAVYIGDSDVDIDTARNCGMPCISVLWGFRDRDFLIEHGATTLVKSPEEISAI
jgi:phosphoglycolate phosphatase